jgi:hypothetical protein
MPRKTNAQLAEENARLRAYLAGILLRINEIEARLSDALDKDREQDQIPLTETKEHAK